MLPPSNCDKSPEQCAIVTPYYVCRAAADEMQECSASIVLKYLQVQCTSYCIFYLENWFSLLWLPYCNCPSIFSICLNLNLLYLVLLMLIFQVLKNISNEKNHTVVLPIPNILMKNQVEKSRKVWTMCFSNKLIFYQEDNFDLLKD